MIVAFNYSSVYPYAFTCIIQEKSPRVVSSRKHKHMSLRGILWWDGWKMILLETFFFNQLISEWYISYTLYIFSIQCMPCIFSLYKAHSVYSAPGESKGSRGSPSWSISCSALHQEPHLGALQLRGSWTWSWSHCWHSPGCAGSGKTTFPETSCWKM